MKRRLQWLIILALAGVLLSAYSLRHHYDTSEGWCNISSTLNCDVVNRGPYSEIASIPVSLIGLIGYAGIAAAAWFALKRPSERKELVMLERLALIGALGLSLYLTYIEAFVLHVYCPLCLGSLGLVAALASISFLTYKGA